MSFLPQRNAAWLAWAGVLPEGEEEAGSFVAPAATVAADDTPPATGFEATDVEAPVADAVPGEPEQGRAEAGPRAGERAGPAADTVYELGVAFEPGPATEPAAQAQPQPMILQVSSQETRPAVEPAAGPSLDEVPSPSAVDGESVAPEFEILLGGTAWERMAGETLVLRYSFMAAAPSYANSHERATFSAMDATEREAVRAALDSYAALIDVRFEEVADSDGTDLRFGRSDQRSAAHAYLPGDPGEPARPGEGGAAGDVWLGEDWATLAGAASPDAFLRFVLLHEIGHALGLEHPSVEGASQDDTVMSYTPGQEAGSRLPDSPMSLDIAALRALYGAHEHAGADPSVPAGADGDPLPF